MVRKSSWCKHRLMRRHGITEFAVEEKKIRKIGRVDVKLVRCVTKAERTSRMQILAHRLHSGHPTKHHVILMTSIEALPSLVPLAPSSRLQYLIVDFHLVHDYWNLPRLQLIMCLGTKTQFEYYKMVNKGSENNIMQCYACMLVHTFPTI